MFALPVMLFTLEPLEAQTAEKTIQTAGQTAGKTKAAMCWPAAALGAKEGEEKIKRAGRSGVIPPLKRTPISAPSVPPGERLPIRRVKLPKGVKLVALTFDLCEQPYEIAGYQGGIVDFLRKHKIKATFFAGGKWMLTHRERAQQLMADPLFEMANHSWEHLNLRLLTGAGLEREIGAAQTAYEQVREELAAKQCLAADGRKLAHLRPPKRLGLFRFPFGACNPESLEAVGEMGLRAIQWDISSGDPWIGQTAELMVQAVRSKVKPGSIILFHANGRGWNTTSALPDIVKDLAERGYGFATVSELLEAGTPEYSETCYDSRPGDTARYDKLARRLAKQYDRWRSKVLSSPIAPEAVPAPTRAKRPVADKEQ